MSNLNRFPQLKVQVGHTSKITCSVLSQDLKYTLTGDQGGSVRLWHNRTGVELHTYRLRASRGAVRSVAFLEEMVKDNKLPKVLIHYKDGNACIHSGHNYTKLFDSKRGYTHLRLFVTKAGVKQAYAISNEGSDYIISILNIESNKASVHFEQEFKLPRKEDKVRDLALSDNGHYAAICSSKAVIVFTLIENKIKRLYGIIAKDAGAGLSTLAISNNGTVATASKNQVLVISRTKKNQQRSIRWLGQPSKRSISSLCFMQNRIFAGSTDGHVYEWDLVSESDSIQHVHDFPGHTGVSSIDVAPNGQLLVATQGPQIYVRELDKQGEISKYSSGKLPTYSKVIKAVATSSKSPHYIAIVASKELFVWNIQSGKQILATSLADYGIQSGKIESVEFSPDNQYLLVLLDSEKAVRLPFKTANRTPIYFPSGHDERVKACAFSADGSTVFTYGSGYLIAYDIGSGREKFRRFVSAEEESGKVVLNITEKEIIIALNSLTIFTMEEHNPTAEDPAPKKPLPKMPLKMSSTARRRLRHQPVAVSPDGELFVSVWNTTRQMPYVFKPEGKSYGYNKFREDISQLRWRPHGSQSAYPLIGYQFLSVHRDGRVRTWNPEQKNHLLELPANQANAFDACYSADGRFIITAGTDNIVRIWDANSGDMYGQIATLEDENQEDQWVVTDAKSRFDSSNIGRLQGLHWIMPKTPNQPLPIESFMRDYFEPQLLSKVLNGSPLPELRDISTLNLAQPEVEITDVKINKEQHTATLEVHVCISEELQYHSSDKLHQTGSVEYVQGLSVFRDNQIVTRIDERIDHATLPSNITAVYRSDKVILTINDIQLPKVVQRGQEIEFSAYAFNEDFVKGLTTYKTIQAPKYHDHENIEPKVYIVSIGVNRSDIADNLSYAVVDAEAILGGVKTALSSHTQTGQIEPVPIALTAAHDQPPTATLSHVQAVLDRLANRPPAQLDLEPANFDQLQAATPDDTLIITFSGHGENIQDADSGRDSFNLILNDGRLSSDTLTQWLDGVDAGNIALVIDACYSAASIDDGSFKPGPMGDKGLGQLAYNKGMLVLAASQSDEIALEIGSLSHGLLTFALVEDGLNAGEADFGSAEFSSNDNRINLAEWLEFGATHVPNLYQELKTSKSSGMFRGKAIDNINVGKAITSKSGNNNGTTSEIKDLEEAPQKPAFFNFRKRGQKSVALMRLD